MTYTRTQSKVRTPVPSDDIAMHAALTSPLSVGHGIAYYTTDRCVSIS